MDASVIFVRWHQCAHTSNTCSLSPTRVHIPSHILIGSSVLAQLTVESAVTSQQNAPSPLQNCLGDLDPIHGPPKSITQMHLNQYIHFLQAHNCDKPTDQQRYTLLHLSFCKNRPHIRYVLLRCVLIMVLQCITTNNTQ